MKRIIVSLASSIIVAIVLTGCNQASHEVQPMYISSYGYENKSCDTLKRELKYIQERANIMTQRVDDKKDSQDTKLAFGWLFWPSYIIIDDNKMESQELSKLRGEYNAITRVLDTKKCSK